MDENDVQIFIKACKPTKKSTGMFVRLIDCIFYNDNYKVFMELSSRCVFGGFHMIIWVLEGRLVLGWFSDTR